MTPPFWRRIPGNWSHVLRIFARRPEDDVDSELRFHFGERIAELTAKGIPAADARSQATEEFGDLNAVRAQLQDIDQRVAQRRRRAEWWERAAQDMRIAVRGLRRNPGVSLGVIGSLALGIGATSTMFTFISAVLLRPLPYPDQGALLALEETNRGVVAEPHYLGWARESHTLASIALYVPTEATMQGATGSEVVRGARISPSLLAVLRVHPVLGRFVSDADARDGAEPVVLVSWTLWHRQFADDSGIVGRTVRLGDEAYRVIGVMPAGFAFPRNVEFWRPWISPPAVAPATSAFFVSVVGRPRPGVSLAQVHGELLQLAARMDEQLPPRLRIADVTVTTLHDELYGSARGALLILFVAVSLLLLIACANVANLVLVRAIRRRGEFAVRATLGAGPAALARLVLAETFVLATAGGALGLGITLWVTRLWSRSVRPVSRKWEKSASTAACLYLPD